MTNLPVEVDVLSVKQMLDSGQDFLLLDCREQVEYDIAFIGGATLLPMSEIQSRIEELTPHKLRPVVVHCHHGGRSQQVTWWLRQQGFEQARNMTGGIDIWSQQVDPNVPRYS